MDPSSPIIIAPDYKVMCHKILICIAIWSAFFIDEYN